MSASSSPRLVQGPVRRTIVKLTLPMIWGLIAIIGFNVVDTFFVGQLGKPELAAMGFTFPVVAVLFNLSIGLGIGASSVIARAIGEADPQRVRRLTTDSLLLSTLVFSLVSLVGYLSIEPLFRALGATEELLPLIAEYMEVWYIGILFLVVPMVGNSAIRAAGDTVFPSLIMTLAAVVNLVLDPLLIFGLWGFPRWELAGAAWATVAARFITLVAAFYVLIFREKMISFERLRLHQVLQSWKALLKIAVPASATNLISPISIGIITALLAQYGSEAVAAFGVVSRIESFALIPILAMSSTIGPFVGQNWGAKQKARTHQGVIFNFQLCLVWSLLTTVLLWLLAEPIMQLFSLDPEVIRLGVFYLKYIPITLGFVGILYCANASFNALGFPLKSTALSAIRMFVTYIPVAYVLGHFYGVEGIYSAAAISYLVSGVLAYAVYQRFMRYQSP